LDQRAIEAFSIAGARLEAEELYQLVPQACAVAVTSSEIIKNHKLSLLF
jgi:hypothetical protein